MRPWFDGSSRDDFIEAAGGRDSPEGEMWATAVDYYIWLIFVSDMLVSTMTAVQIGFSDGIWTVPTRFWKTISFAAIVVILFDSA